MKKGLHPSKQSIKDQSNESIATGSAWENLRESVSKTKKHQITGLRRERSSQSSNDSTRNKF